jgi:hypothetical protein
MFAFDGEDRTPLEVRILMCIFQIFLVCGFCARLTDMMMMIHSSCRIVLRLSQEAERAGFEGNFVELYPTWQRWFVSCL